MSAIEDHKLDILKITEFDVDMELKQQGNDAYKAGNYSLALKLYDQAAGAIEFAIRQFHTPARQNPEFETCVPAIQQMSRFRMQLPTRKMG